MLSSTQTQHLTASSTFVTSHSTDSYYNLADHKGTIFVLSLDDNDDEVLLRYTITSRPNGCWALTTMVDYLENNLESIVTGDLDGTIGVYSLSKMGMFQRCEGLRLQLKNISLSKQSTPHRSFPKVHSKSI